MILGPVQLNFLDHFSYLVFERACRTTMPTFSSNAKIRFCQYDTSQYQGIGGTQRILDPSCFHSQEVLWVHWCEHACNAWLSYGVLPKYMGNVYKVVNRRFVYVSHMHASVCMCVHPRCSYLLVSSLRTAFCICMHALACVCVCRMALNSFVYLVVRDRVFSRVFVHLVGSVHS